MPLVPAACRPLPRLLAALLAALMPGAAMADQTLDRELAAIVALLPGRYEATLPDPRGGAPLVVAHEILPVEVPAFGPGRAFYHQISRDGFDADVPFQQKVYVFDEEPGRPRNRMRSFVLAPGAPTVSPARGPAALAALAPAATLTFPPGCIINWSGGDEPGTWVARVRREDCSYRSERFRQLISPQLTYIVAPDWLAVEDLLFGAGGESLVPSPGLARAKRLPGPPAGFVDVATVVPGLAIDMRYHGRVNFIGRPVAGYADPVCLLTAEAAAALAGVQARLRAWGLGLKVYDCYRPTRAVDDFVRWAADRDDEQTRPEYYPDIPKQELFARGYIAARSGHSRGSTVDLTLVDLASGAELDMGTGYDWFGPRAWPGAPDVSPAVRAHRLLLQGLMGEAGFEPYAQEWWHFTLAAEPFPDRYFDFVVRRPPPAE